MQQTTMNLDGEPLPILYYLRRVYRRDGKLVAATRRNKKHP